jgi:hypothetical protein
LKEVIEYLLAALIIVSIIPIYDYIASQLYSPPELLVDYSYINLFTTQIIPILQNETIHGNLTSPFFNLKHYLESKIYYLSSEYLFRIDIVSSGMQSINYDNETGNISIISLSNTNPVLLIIANNNGYPKLYSVVINTTPTTLANGTYMYEFNVESIGIAPQNVIYILCVQDTGLYRYIDSYRVRGKIHVAKITENNGIIGVAVPHTQINDSAMNAIVVFYGSKTLYWYNNTIYNSTTKITGNSLIMVEHNISYILFLNKTLTYCNTQYNIYNLTVNIFERTISYHYKQGGGRGRGRKSSGNIATEIGNTTIHDYVETPIYNLVLIVFMTRNGDIYIAEWYPHSFSIGNTIPRDIPVRKISLTARLGMFDYTLTVYMWRRTL